MGSSVGPAHWCIHYVPQLIGIKQNLRATGLRKSEVRKQSIGKFWVGVQSPSQTLMFYIVLESMCIIIKNLSIVLRCTVLSINSQMLTVWM